jgi:hypothetical protein
MLFAGRQDHSDHAESERHEHQRNPATPGRQSKTAYRPNEREKTDEDASKPEVNQRNWDHRISVDASRVCLRTTAFTLCGRTLPHMGISSWTDSMRGEYVGPGGR